MFNIANFKPLTTRIVGRTGLQLQKYSPEILTAVGVVGVVTAGVLASRATLKLSPIIEKKNDHLETIKETRDDEKIAYSEKEANSDIAKVYIRTGLEVVKLYGPSITLGIASIGCIVSAHGILRRRNVALAAAYKTIESAFSEYRKRVQEEIGDERELAISRNEYAEVEKDEETGEEKSVVRPHTGASPYAKFFDELSGQWTKNPDYNYTFLMAQESIFNDLLHSRGHVFLNEVYDALDIPRTKAGNIVGWVSGKGGDDFISFGIHDQSGLPSRDEKKREFVNGYERSILLDFNVDGPILDLI